MFIRAFLFNEKINSTADKKEHFWIDLLLRQTSAAAGERQAMLA